MRINFNSVVANKANICIAFLNCYDNNFRASSGFFCVLNALELIVFPVLFNDGNISPNFHIECVIGAGIHPVFNRPVYSQPVCKFMKLEFFNPYSQPYLYFFNLFRAEFIICRIGFPFVHGKNKVSLFNDIFQVPEVVKGLGCYCNFTFPAFQRTICDPHTFFTPVFSIPSALPSLASVSISTSIPSPVSSTNSSPANSSSVSPSR